MKELRFGFIALATAVLFSVAPTAGTSAKPTGLRTPFTLTADTHADAPGVAVDDNGTGFFVWDSVVGGAYNNPFHYCRVQRGATRCDVTKTFNLPHFAFDTPHVLLPAPGEVVLTTYRCCNSALYAIVSHDGGKSFDPPHIIGTLPPNQVILGPGSGTVSVVDNDDTEGIHYQAAPLDSFTDTTAAVGSSADYQVFDGTVGLTDVNTPIVAFADQHKAFFRVWSGAGDLNDASSWQQARPLGLLTDLRLASGVKGAVLLGKQQLTNPSRDVYVTRRWNPVTGSFRRATRISDPAVESSVTNRDIYEDAGGNITAVFESNRQDNNFQFPYPLEYRVSKDGGKTWLSEQTLVETDEAISHLAVAAGPDGGGWVAWNDEHGLRAASIPPISTQPGGGPDPNCPQTLQFHSVHALAVAGCFEKGRGGVYTTTDPVRVDGLDLDPTAAGKIVIDTVTGEITGTGIEALAGNVLLNTGNFDWNAGGSAPVTTFDNLGSFHDSIFGFPVTGDASLSFENGVATIPVHVELPGIFGGVTGDMVLKLKNPGGLELDRLHVHVDDAFLGLMEVKSLDVTYQGGQPASLEGSATFLLPPTYSQPGVDVGFGFSGGEFKHAEGAFPLTIPLFPPFLYLQKIGLALSTDPLTIKGGVEMSGGPQILGGAAIQMDALPCGRRRVHLPIVQSGNSAPRGQNVGGRHSVRRRLCRVPHQRSSQVRGWAQFHTAARRGQPGGGSAGESSAGTGVRGPNEWEVQRTYAGACVRAGRV